MAWLAHQVHTYSLPRSWHAATASLTQNLKKTTGAPSFARCSLVTAPPRGGCPRSSWRGVCRSSCSCHCTQCPCHETSTGRGLQFLSTSRKRADCGTLRKGGVILTSLPLHSLQRLQPNILPQLLAIQPCACRRMARCSDVASWHRGLDRARPHAESRVRLPQVCSACSVVVGTITHNLG